MNATDDRSLVYYAVVDEAVSADDADVKIISHTNNVNGLNYLRFNACVQSFGKRNRNRRLWLSKWVKMMLEAEIVVEAIAHGSMAGESGHPVPAVGDVTANRIVTVDPNNVSHRFMNFDWKANDSLLYATVETLDDGAGSPGFRFMRHILQGMDPAFSLRSIVPQRKNPDGTTDVVGAGRLVTYDRVLGPSHKEAYINAEVPIQNVNSQSDIQSVMESFGVDMFAHSDKIKQILDNLSPIMESISIDPVSATVSVKTAKYGDRIIIAPEMKYRRDIQDLFLG